VSHVTVRNIFDVAGKRRPKEKTISDAVDELSAALTSGNSDADLNNLTQMREVAPPDCRMSFKHMTSKTKREGSDNDIFGPGLKARIIP
jgi:hypothetical protein